MKSLQDESAAKFRASDGACDLAAEKQLSQGSEKVLHTSHPDVIAIDEHTLARAITGQFARALVALTSSKEEIDEQVACMSVPVQVKGNGISEDGEKMFTIEHLIVSDVYVDGVILRCPVSEQLSDDPNEDAIAYVFVRLIHDDTREARRFRQQINPIVYTVSEQEVVRDGNAIVRRLTALLYET